MNNGREGPAPHSPASGRLDSVTIVVVVGETVVSTRVDVVVLLLEVPTAVDTDTVLPGVGGATVEREEATVTGGGRTVAPTGERKSHPQDTVVPAHIHCPGSHRPKLLVSVWQKLSPTGPGQAPLTPAPERSIAPGIDHL